MAKSKIKDYTLSWAASQVSAQNLMDRASIFGTVRTLREESVWRGSPLRVHRRCLEPMFTISNTIAYENSMLFATTEENNVLLHPSCWWDVGGRANIRQYVPEQRAKVVDLTSSNCCLCYRLFKDL